MTPPTRSTRRPHASRDARRTRLTFRRATHAELLKLATLRSTRWTAVLVVLAGVGISVAASLVANPMPAGASSTMADAGTAAILTTPLLLSQIVVGVLGVLAMGSEYSSGTIASTLAAVPDRLEALSAKALAVALVAFGLGVIPGLGAYLLTAGTRADVGYDGSLASWGVLGPLLGSGAYLAMVALLGLALATMMRSGVAAITALIAIQLVLPQLVALVPDIGDVAVYDLLLTTAGRILTGTTGSIAPPPTTLLEVAATAAWLVIPATAAALLFRRRDA
ncbi:ABC transporter permease [Clavibacter sepedonicus]|uniref:Integral membrane protein n=1 Tax=Clavibacter sepedonicus TaxID=31964 RepID=B0RCH5_CLASE|nr:MULTISPECIES: ABC transporter permease [Clavibacter]MBD5381054.1 ABC transporter permease [Clavibacter sp.]OQJ48983.1 ABC transporter permease [Clavibacter sepedonicus]OQJ53707.1 ABC transporter permease [Clavibacter sepedonicus]UUK65168.1 ABC transporter permease [Clavibacter sepedonicus]CAQ00574.1 putative integral membrane protein [Clavibacter sepedonicus]